MLAGQLRASIQASVFDSRPRSSPRSARLLATIWYHHLVFVVQEVTAFRTVTCEHRHVGLDLIVIGKRLIESNLQPSCGGQGAVVPFDELLQLETALSQFTASHRGHSLSLDGIGRRYHAPPWSGVQTNLCLWMSISLPLDEHLSGAGYCSRRRRIGPTLPFPPNQRFGDEHAGLRLPVLTVLAVSIPSRVLCPPLLMLTHQTSIIPLRAG